MAELDKSIPQIGAVDMLTITQIFNSLIRQHEEAKRSAMRVRLPNTSYNVGDKVIALGVANFDKVLRCERAGVSGVGEFPKDYNTLKIGDVIQDGSLTWAVVDLVTIPDFEDNPVVSVNGKTGTVNLTPSDIGASAENHGHDDLFNAHKAELASTTQSGHVKIDGETIVNENGIIKAVSSQESTLLVNQMPNKAEIDFSNVNSNIDFVVESYQGDKTQGYRWYRLYKSGWLEQGGICVAFGEVSNQAFLREFADCNYVFSVGNIDLTAYNKVSSADKFKVHGDRSYKSTDGIYVAKVGQSWHACGWAKVEE